MLKLMYTILKSQTREVLTYDGYTDITFDDGLVICKKDNKEYYYEIIDSFYVEDTDKVYCELDEDYSLIEFSR